MIGLLLALALLFGISRWGHQQGLGWDLGLLGQHHRVTLTWTASVGATTYRIYRTTVSGRGYVKIGACTETRFVDSDVSSGATYYYAVTAVSKDDKESARSAEAKAVVPQ